MYPMTKISDHEEALVREIIRFETAQLEMVLRGEVPKESDFEEKLLTALAHHRALLMEELAAEIESKRQVYGVAPPKGYTPTDEEQWQAGWNDAIDAAIALLK